MNDQISKKIFSKTAGMVAVSLTASAVLLQIFSTSRAGPLWRDEVGMANIAKLSSTGEIFEALLHDHCPMVFPLVLRTATTIGLPQTDLGLRFFGLVVGLSLIAAFWVASRLMYRGLPLMSLSLAAVNAVVIRFGDSLRAYALGMVFMIITMGLIWRFIENSKKGHGFIAGLAAIVSVQTLYQNAFFLLAVCVAGIVICLRQKQKAKAWAVFFIGLIAAISLLPYVKPIHDAQTWWIVSKSGITFLHTLHCLEDLMGKFFSIWIAAMILTAAFGIEQFSHTSGDVKQNNLCLFGGISLVIGLVGFGVFVKLAGLPTQVWYYIPILCFSAICCDVVLMQRSSAIAFGALIVAVAALIFSTSNYSALRWRQTNGDLVAAQVAAKSDSDDFIIVHPWYYGITFSYYYGGTAKWTTLPPISDYRFHRYDLIKEKLATPHAVEPVLQQVEKTLRNGHRMWIVGQLPAAPPADKPAPADPPIAPNGPLGWSDHPYSDAWGCELGYLLIRHATNITLLVDPATNAPPINWMEPMALIVVSGWTTNNP